MKITDINPRTNARQQFQAEIDDERWATIDAVDFFDYLEAARVVDGHDPENCTAWVYIDEGYFNYRDGVWVERERPKTSPYDDWLQEVEFEEVERYLKSKTEAVTA